VAPIAGVAPGVAMAPTESITSISTGTGVETADADPLAPKPGNEHKARFAARQTEQEAQAAQAKLAKAEVKATARPVTATTQETAAEKTQAAPLGLNGDTVKKVKKKKDKNAPKERMQEKAKPEDTTTPVAPTVNPALGTGVGTTPAPAAAPAPAPASTTPPPQ